MKIRNKIRSNIIKNKDSGISLISLIITIIVILILAAIVIFTGLNTPDSAQFANFTQQVDNVQMAVTNKFADLKTKHSIEGRSRTDEQIYLEIATGEDHEMDKFMGTTENNLKSTSEESTGIQNITVNGALDKEHSIAMTLPKVRESNTAWYVTKEGRVFNANGYVYNGKTYYDATHYEEGEKGSNSEVNAGRALAVYNSIKNNNVLVAGAPEDGTATETLHTVTYNANGGTGTIASQIGTSITLSDGTGLTAPEGKVLTSWNTSADGTGTTYAQNAVVGLDLNLYAQWVTSISKATTGDGFVGYYADIDNNGTVDGVIYVDLLVQKPASGYWNASGKSSNNTYGTYTLPTTVDASNVKNYAISSRNYGLSEAGRYKANDGFGEKDVLVPASGGTEERFYIMGLNNIVIGTWPTLYWYESAYGEMENPPTATSKDFGTGKTNTENMIAKWDLGSATGGYGAPNDRDMWKWVKAKREEYSGWFVPSRAEWAAFAKAFNISKTSTGATYYTKFGLDSKYWSSSQVNDKLATYAYFGIGTMNSGNVFADIRVRLSATF